MFTFDSHVCCRSQPPRALSSSPAHDSDAGDNYHDKEHARDSSDAVHYDV